MGWKVNLVDKGNKQKRKILFIIFFLEKNAFLSLKQVTVKNATRRSKCPLFGIKLKSHSYFFIHSCSKKNIVKICSVYQEMCNQTLLLRNRKSLISLLRCADKLPFSCKQCVYTTSSSMILFLNFRTININ